MLIESLTLYTASLHRTRLFYHQTLELPIVAEDAECISFRAGRTILTFAAAVAGTKPYYHIAFNITNNRFSDSFEWLNRKLDILLSEDGLPIVPYPNWNAQSFYFYDNNGSILEFIVRFDLPYSSSASFSTADIREISEAGLVTENPTAMATSLNARGVPYFAKGPRLPDFVAMGDDYGLLLVTGKGKGWVPVHKPAQPFPLQLRSADGLTLQL